MTTPHCRHDGRCSVVDAIRKCSSEFHRRASLVPAAAVIPASAAYTNVAAVKKLVVDCRAEDDAGFTRGLEPRVLSPLRFQACWRTKGRQRLRQSDFSFSCLRLLYFVSSFATHGCSSTATTLLEWWVVACTRMEHVPGAASRSCVSSCGRGVWWMSVVVTVNKTVCLRQARKSSDIAGTS